MALRFLRVRFPNAKIDYTYTYDGEEPIEPGGKVDVFTRDGIVTVPVVEVSNTRPDDVPAHIKPIEGVFKSRADAP